MLNFFTSITAKLLSLMIGSLLLALLSVFFISRNQLRIIIDQSQLSLYQERIEILRGEMERSNDKLKKTGLYEVYKDDFQKSSLEVIKKTYYKEENPEVYPFILDWKLNVVLHPDLPAGDSSMAEIEAFYRLKYKNLHELNASYRGEMKWYVFEHFDPWNWIIVYTVPLREKYGELRKFQQILLFIIILIALILFPLLTVISLNLTKPIVQLTHITRKISEGDLDQIIPATGRDEVSLLSHSFAQMQQAIKQKIEDLNREMRDKERMEEQLIQARKMDAIGQLAGGVAHDFNNMLAGISSAAQLLQMDETIREESRQFVRMIQETAERAADLTGKLLAFGRKQHMAEEEVDIHRIIDDSLYLLERTLDRKVHINVEKRAAKSYLSGDFTALQNCIMNLAINAAHAMPEGGELTLSTKNTRLDREYCHFSQFPIEPGDYIEVTVRDTGTGIPQNLQDKIFDPFFTTKERGKGTGLGLSLVYGTVQDHRGAITVYSEVGIGTVFHIYLPLVEISEISTSSPADGDSWQGSGAILLVDDEEIIRLTGKPLLEKLGFQVLLATQGEEALEIFSREREKIRLVITDMIMPRMGGRELFYKLRERDETVPVLLSSGFARPEDILSMERDGLAGFLQKPFGREEMGQTIHRILSPSQPG